MQNTELKNHMIDARISTFFSLASPEITDGYNINYAYSSFLNKKHYKTAKWITGNGFSNSQTEF